MNDIRSFIAIELPDDIRQSIDNVTRQLRARGIPAIRWVHVNNIHLTLQFLGEVPSKDLNAIAEQLKLTAKQSRPFEIRISGLGCFPNRRQPRVIWVGVKAPPELAALQKSIQDENVRLGITPENRAFSPHLTLGRIAHDVLPSDLARISEILSSTTIGELGKFTPTQIILFRSELRSEGAQYSPLIAAPLGE